MKKSILEIYAFAVCFVTIICFAFSLGIGIYDILEISAPSLTLRSYDYERHKTNEAFTINWTKEKKETYTDQEITNLREESYQMELAEEKRDAMQSFIMVSIIILIDIALFLIHWKLAKKQGNQSTHNRVKGSG